MAKAPLKFARDSAKEAKWLAEDHSSEIAQSGMTPEQYLASRGGINENGQWGDTFIEGFTGQPKDVQEKYIAENNAFTSLGQDQYGTFFVGTTAAGTTAQTAAPGVMESIQSKWPKDPLGASNRLSELVNKANSGAPRPAPDSAYRGIEIVGSLSPAEAAEYAYLRDNVNKFIKSGPTVYGQTLPDGTIVNTYDLSKAGGSDVQNYMNLKTGNYADSTTENPYALGTEEAKAWDSRKSAYDILFQEFSRYGLGSMVEPLKSLITEGVSPSEFGLRLTQTDAYKKRFAANQDRINKGLRALTPAEYIGLEDQYQSIMRNYGLPASYYTKGDLGTQEGFNKLLASDVSAAELEDRIATAQKRVLNTNPEVLQALKQFYPDLNNADILAYTLDPDKALSEIQRKVTAAEIGGAALAQGLQAQGGTAEALAGLGITKAQAQQGYQTIGEFLPSAQKLGDIYQNQGLGAYDQATAEREVFGMQGAASAAQKRKKLAGLEQAAFSGQAGAAQGALDRGRQGAF